jgi:hypothetical protein
MFISEKSMLFAKAKSRVDLYKKAIELPQVTVLFLVISRKISDCREMLDLFHFRETAKIVKQAPCSSGVSSAICVVHCLFPDGKV